MRALRKFLVNWFIIHFCVYIQVACVKHIFQSTEAHLSVCLSFTQWPSHFVVMIFHGKPFRVPGPFSNKMGGPEKQIILSYS